MTTAHLNPTITPAVFEGTAEFPVRGQVRMWLVVTGRPMLWVRAKRNALERDGEALVGTASVEGYPYSVTCRRDGFGWSVEFSNDNDTKENIP